MKHNTSHQKKTGKPIMLMGILAACALFAAVLVTLVVKSTRVDPFAYITVTFAGYNTNGRTQVDFQKTQMIEAVIGEEPGTLEELNLWLGKYDTYDRGVDITYEPQKGLSNGDKVIVTVRVSDATRKKVKAGKKEYIVKGLPEIQTVDFFKDVAIHYSGCGNQSRAELQLLSDGDAIRNCHFQIEPEFGVHNGDTVTLTITNPEQLAEDFLCIPKEIQKTFQVSGLDEYLNDSDLLPEEQIRHIIDRFLADSRKENDGWFQYSEPQYYKTFLLTAKENTYFVDENRLEIYVC